MRAGLSRSCPLGRRPRTAWPGYSADSASRWRRTPHALDEYTEEKFVHLDLSGRLDRRAYALLLSTPPS